jgi:hypothetical protein
VFPPKDGVSRNINPRELITGVKIDYNKHIQAEFGEYVQVHEEHDNTMRTRTTDAIATKPTGNAQGGHWFYSLTTGRMLDRRKWTPLPMPGDDITHIDALAKASQVGLDFTNMQNEAYPDDDNYDSDENSDDDSDYGSDDDSSNGDDDNYDDFIAGVEQHNSDPPDPPDASIDETPDDETPHQDDEDSIAESNLDNAEEDDNDTVDSENGTEDIPEDITDKAPIAVTPTNHTLKNLTDNTGVLPPTINSRTRQQAQNNGESLLTGANEWKTAKTVISKKQRKLRKELQSQLQKKEEEEEETKRKLRNKLKNAKRRLKKCKEAPNAPGLMIDEILEAEYEREHGHPSPIPFGFSGCVPKTNLTQVKTVDDQEASDAFGDLRDQLRSEQKPGVCFPHDSCSSKDLAPDLEAVALTQYTLKRGLKEFDKDGLIALGREMEQLHTRKVAKPIDSMDLTKEQKQATLRYLMFLSKKRCGRIKARGCADGRKQRQKTSLVYASNWTLSRKVLGSEV